MVTNSAHEIHLLFDDGKEYGLGHRRRMYALERAFSALDVPARAIPIEDWMRSPEVASRAVVVDAYSQRADALSVDGCAVVAIDDLDRGLKVDLVVEPSPVPLESQRSAGTTSLLSGFEYALLEQPQSADLLPAQSGRVLVSMGGSDVRGRGARIIETLAEIAPRAGLVHVPGPWSKRSSARGVSVIAPESSMMKELSRSEVVVCAGGVTALEALMLGRPTVVVPTADNQSRAVMGIREAEAAVIAENADDFASIANEVVCLINDEDLRIRLAEAGRSLIDGRGAERVATVILRMLQAG